jgi:hypothetical protein
MSNEPCCGCGVQDGLLAAASEFACEGFHDVPAPWSSCSSSIEDFAQDRAREDEQIAGVGDETDGQVAVFEKFNRRL